MKGVESFSVRYLDLANQWHTRWPPLNINAQQIGMPRALEITIKLETMDEIKRLFASPT